MGSIEDLVIDRILKEELIRVRLSHLGFELEKNGFGWIVRDRWEHRDMPALQRVRLTISFLAKSLAGDWETRASIIII